MPLSCFRRAIRLVLAAFLIAFPVFAHAQYTLYYRSHPGDYVGQGQIRTITNASSSFTIGGSVARDEITVTAGNASVYLRSANGEILTVGTYEKPDLYPPTYPASPALNATVDGRPCGDYTGRFQILELTRDSQGFPISLAVDFEQHCYGAIPALLGQLRFNSAVPIDSVRRRPDPFSFDMQTNMAPWTYATSLVAPINGLDIPIPVSVTGGTYALNGGAFTSAAGTVQNGDKVQVRLITAPTPNTVATATLDLGGYLVPFSAGTSPGTTPQPTGSPLVVLFAQRQFGVDMTTTTVISPATQQVLTPRKGAITGNEQGIGIDSRGPGEGYPTFSVYLFGALGGPIVPGTYTHIGRDPRNGQSALQVNAITSATLGNIPMCEYGVDGIEHSNVIVHEVELSADGVPTRLAFDFVTTCHDPVSVYSLLHGHVRFNSTYPIDYGLRSPLPFSFAGVTNALPSTQYVSTTGAATGITLPIPVSISGGEYSIAYGPFTSAPGMISGGENIRVRLTSAATPNTLRVATLTMGDTDFPFKVGTAIGGAPQPASEPLIVIVSVPVADAEPITTEIYSPASLDNFALVKEEFIPGWIAFIVNPSDALFNQQWRVVFGGIGASAIAPGTYPLFGYFQSDFQPAFQFRNSGVCSQYAFPPSSMVIHEAEYLVDGTPTRLAADIAITCDDDSELASRYVHVRFNSSVPIDYTINEPGPFTFTPFRGASRGVQIISNEVTIRAINVPVPVTIADGEYSIDGGAFTAAPGTIVAGQKLRVRVTTSSQANTLTAASVRVGARTEIFRVGTAIDPQPQPNGAPLVVMFSQQYITGTTSLAAYSPATLDVVELATPSYTPWRTAVTVLPTYPISPWGYYNPWALYVAGPYGALLQVGSYDQSLQYIAELPYFSIYDNLVMPACPNGMGTVFPRAARFIVREIEHSVTGQTLRLALDYVETCAADDTVSASTAAIFGFVRINSTLPIDYTIRQPVPFRFIPALGVTPGAVVQSEEITIQGINVSVPISISGGEFRIDGGAYTSLAGTIAAGQRVSVRTTASAIANTLTTSTLTAGEYVTTFKVGTAAGTTPPANGEPIVFLISQGSEYIGGGKTLVLSAATLFTLSASKLGGNEVAVLASDYGTSSDSNWQLYFSAPNGVLLSPGIFDNMLGSPFFSSTGHPGMRVTGQGRTCSSLAAGSQFTVHEVQYNGSQVARLAIDFVQHCNDYPDLLYGYIRFNSTVPITPITDSNPAPFSFATRQDAPASTSVTSAPLTIGGFNVSLPISVGIGEYSIDGGAFTRAPGILNPGQSVQLRVISSALFGDSVMASLTVGNRTGTFQVFTEPRSTTPNPLPFPTVTGAVRNTLVTSAILTVTGMNTPVPIFISGAGTGEFSIGGRPFTNVSSTILPGETLQLRLLSGSTYNATDTMYLGVGGRSVTFTVQTLSQAVLQVTLNGPGRVNIAPLGVVCNETCSMLVDEGTQLTLTATPGAGVIFTGWTGAGCSGTGSCAINLSLTASVTAAFSAQPPGAPTITQALAGNGQATIHFSPPAFTGGTPVTAYTATCQPGNVTGNAATSPITVRPLANDAPHTCSVTATNSAGMGLPSAAVAVTPSASVALALLAVQSRKTHGTAAVLGLPIDFAQPINGLISVEPRTIGSGHQIVFQFNATVTSVGAVFAVDGANVTISASAPAISGNEVTIMLTGSLEGKRVAISLAGVNGSLSPNASIGFLLGDVNGSRAVDGADSSTVKSRAGWSANSDNFMYDINVSGDINAADISAVKSRSGRALP